MSSRRQFLTSSLMAVGAWSFSKEVEAGRRRRRTANNQSAVKVPPPKNPSAKPPAPVVARAIEPTEAPVKVALLPEKWPDRFIQPNSTHWLLVGLDMTERQVVALLGEPLEKTDNSEWYQRRFEKTKYRETDALRYDWTYGWLKFNSPAFPEPCRFTVSFVAGMVSYISDPFDGDVSSEGEPTTPKPILPANRTSFQHYPRWLDLRWYPTAGDYPQQYHIDVETSAGEDSNEWAFGKAGVGKVRYKSDVPQFTLVFSGANLGRWRVRATNRHGVSDWSEYSYFKFTV